MSTMCGRQPLQGNLLRLTIHLHYIQLSLFQEVFYKDMVLIGLSFDCSIIHRQARLLLEVQTLRKMCWQLCWQTNQKREKSRMVSKIKLLLT